MIYDAIENDAVCALHLRARGIGAGGGHRHLPGYIIVTT